MIDKAVIRRNTFPDFNEDFMKEEVFETGGVVSPDGQCIELIRSNDGALSLLDTRRKQSGRTYIPPSLHASILEVLTLPGTHSSSVTGAIEKGRPVVDSEYGPQKNSKKYQLKFKKVVSKKAAPLKKMVKEKASPKKEERARIEMECIGPAEELGK